MCNNHKHEHSERILARAWEDYTWDCCPNLHHISIVPKVESFQLIEGTYPVYNDKARTVMLEMEQLVSIRMEDGVRLALFRIFRESTPEDVVKNIIRKDLFDNLKRAIAMQDDDDLWKNDPEAFHLVKKSSPKWSNLLASLLKWHGYNPETHDLTKQFNDRGTSQLDEYELVITTEPHRIVGMSAFGVYTSCQDWIAKSKSHEYHSYTHQAWANLLDPTVGVAFIRYKGDEQPTVDNVNVKDMLARSLIRILELENGHKVVYVHRLYGYNPYNNYFTSSIEAWEKTLPENWHVIKMFNKSKCDHEVGENKYGFRFTGFKTVKHPISEPVVVYGSSTCTCHHCEGAGFIEYDCNHCDGSGTLTYEELVECPYCDGTGEDENGETCWNCDDNGEVYEEWEDDCPDCDGTGTSRYDCEYCNGEGVIVEDDIEYEPYNDHGEWISFRIDGIYFNVPNYILNWDEETQPTTYVPKVGDKVRVKKDLIVGDTYNGLTLLSSMVTNKVLKVVRLRGNSRVELSNGFNYDITMLEPVNEHQELEVTV